MNATFDTPSYKPSDITLLLSPCTDAPVSVEEKERLVANGGHYSEVFVKESPPVKALLDAFHYALHDNDGAKRLAQHVQHLALELISACRANSKEIVLISLVRAGVPLGVLIKRYLDRYFPAVTASHYGVSIIRGKGIDTRALAHISENHETDNAYFVDGWTGKGSISRELQDAVASPNLPFEYRLIVDSDPAGSATLSATADDWLIPFGLIGAPISGLFSRTLWAEDQFHKAAYFADLQAHDLSAEFLAAVEAYFLPPEQAQPGETAKRDTQRPVAEVITQCLADFALDSHHKIKPGIAEATRSTHRRTPRLIILSERNLADTAYLERIAKEKNIPVQIGLKGGMGPFKAITILK